MTGNKPPVDDDLDDLDDYLDEFQDDILSKPYEEVKRENAAPVQQAAASTTATSDTEKDNKSEELSEDQILENLLKSMDQESPEVKAQFEALLKDLASADESTGNASNSTPSIPTPDANLKDTISSTLNRLKESGAKVDQSIKDEQIPGQDMLADLLAQLDMGGTGGEADMSKLLSDMLGALASKDVLYEPLKDLDAKYPAWLKDNKDKTTADELERYEKQAEIVHAIVGQFEAPDYSADNTEQQAFVSKKLEEMQESGEPPKELVGDLDKLGLGGFGFDGDDIPPQMGADLEQNCQQQ